MKAWWPATPLPANIGDYITYWMMKRDGVDVERVPKDKPGKLLGVGSIIRFAQPGDEVWTSGVMRKGQGGDPAANYRALRGPLTAATMGLAGLPLGDGALCLPRYYKPRPFQPEPKGAPLTFALGAVPHYVDWATDELPREWFGPDAIRISPLTINVEGFIDAVCACARIESSSLHGCIIAEAYGVPWKWVRIGDRLSGDDSKFEDFRLSLPHVNVDDLMEARPWT